MSKGIVGFGHVTIVVNDLAATKHFYGELLGLQEAKRPDWEAPGVWYRIGAAALHVQVKPEFRPDPHPVGPHFAMYTAPDDYHQTIERLRQVTPSRCPRTRTPPMASGAPSAKTPPATPSR